MKQRLAAITDRVARSVVGDDEFGPELQYTILRKIERAALDSARHSEDLYYNLAAAAAKLRRKIYPKPGVALWPDTQRESEL